MRQTLQKLVAAVVMDHGLRDDRAQRGHAARKPRRYAPIVEGKVGTAGASSHESLISAFRAGVHDAATRVEDQRRLSTPPAAPSLAARPRTERPAQSD